MGNNNAADSSAIIIMPRDHDKLEADVQKLRTELSMLILERDDLLYQECKNIEMAFMLTLGSLVYKAYELECAILRLKRKSELIQAKKNRQESIVLSKIDEILDIEFADYQVKLNEQIGRMNSALERSHGQVLSEQEVRELKKLYRSIVKTLHPDLHPDLSEARIQLFHNAYKAYEYANLNEIRLIYEMVGEPENPVTKSDGLAFLVKEKERLTKLLQGVRDGISKIKSEYPYTMKSLIQSAEKTEARKAELKENIEQLEETLTAYAAKIEQMLR